MTVINRPSGDTAVNIPTAASVTAIKTGAGVLRKVIINAPVASGTVTIYDSLTATGTKLATITLPASLLSDGPLEADYNCAFVTGLTVVTTGSNMDTTVTYQ